MVRRKHRLFGQPLDREKESIACHLTGLAPSQSRRLTTKNARVSQAGQTIDDLIRPYRAAVIPAMGWQVVDPLISGTPRGEVA